MSKRVEKLDGINNGNYRDGIDVNLIIKLYVEEKLSMHVIAEKLGCDRGVIKRRLIANDIALVRNPRSDKAKDNQPAKNKKYYSYQASAKRRNIDFNLSLEMFENLTSQNCYYCGCEPNQVFKTDRHMFIYNGIDRVDNTIGYSFDNVVPCCKFCNQMKSDMDSTMFISQINHIYNNLQNNLKR